jgi:hypothetical protein
VALVDQVLHGQPAALEVVHADRAGVVAAAHPVHQDDGDPPPAQLGDPLGHLPDR